MPSDIDWGVDYIKLSFTVDPEQCDLSNDLWTSSNTRSWGEDQSESFALHRMIALETSNVRVDLYVHSNTCHMSFNPSRIISPKSALLLPPESLKTMVERLIENHLKITWPEFVRISEHDEIIWDSNWEESVRITRLDVSRNFTVSDPDLVKQGLPKLPARYGADLNVYVSKKNGWTLAHRTKTSGTDLMYDKSADLNEGIFDESINGKDRLFRFESQLLGSRLKGLGLSRLSNVSPQTVWNAIAKRWIESGWGTPLSGSGDVYEALKHLTITKQENMLGYLALKAAGRTSLMSRHHMLEKDAAAKALGLMPGLPLEMLGAADCRLDLAAGSLTKTN